VSPTVIPNHSELVCERKGLRVPHPEVGAERIDEEEHGRVGGAVHPVGESDAIIGEDH